MGGVRSERRDAIKTRVPSAFLLERAMGFEPTALGLGSRCSTTELRPLDYPRLYTRVQRLRAGFLVTGFFGAPFFGPSELAYSNERVSHTDSLGFEPRMAGATTAYSRI